MKVFGVLRKDFWSEYVKRRSIWTPEHTWVINLKLLLNKLADIIQEICFTVDLDSYLIPDVVN